MSASAACRTPAQWTTRCATRGTSGCRGSPGPCGLVIFGVTGDLARKKLMPAIYDLANRGLLPPGFAWSGSPAATGPTRTSRQIVHDAVKEHARTPFREEVWQQLAEGFRFVQGAFDDDDAFDRLARDRARARREPRHRRQPRVLPVHPAGRFPVVLKQLARSGLSSRRTASSGAGWSSRSRSGTTWPVAPASSTTSFNDVFPEDSVFRIDHYLGKETVQNILALRFANQLFEPIWNAHYVDHVQITMAEDIGIGGRAGYYDGIGAARDVIQNHLLQLLALTAMEEPASFSADGAARGEGQGALRGPAARGRWSGPPRRGQYAAGWQGGSKVRRLPRGGGYPADSTTETYAAIKLRHRQPALGRGAVLPAHRQAPGPPGHRDRGGVQARAAPAVRRDRRPRSSGRTRWSSGCSPTRASRCGSAPRCRAPRWRSATSTWTSPTASRSPSPPPRPTSG